MDYWSRLTHKSQKLPGVEFTIARLSLARRIELGEKIRDIGRKAGFLAAGSSMEDQIEAGLIQRRIDRAYLEWGLHAVRALAIDGEEAGPVDVIERGPEDLVAEILAAIKTELQLSEPERKN